MKAGLRMKRAPPCFLLLYSGAGVTKVNNQKRTRRHQEEENLQMKGKKIGSPRLAISMKLRDGSDQTQRFPHQAFFDPIPSSRN